MSIEQIEEVLPDSVLDDLVLLARGDIDMVEQVIIESLQLKRCGWFWLKKVWVLDTVTVLDKILERRKIVDNLEISDDEEQINNG